MLCVLAYSAISLLATKLEAAEEKKPAANYFDDVVKIGNYHAHFPIIIDLTKKGWTIVTVDSIEIIEPTLNGNIFTTYPQTIYLLRNSKDNATAICSVVGESGGGFDARPTHYISCYK